MDILEDISSFLQQGRAPMVKEKVQEALEQGLKPKEILEKGLLYGMSIVGEKFKKNEIFVPEVLIAARAMNIGIGVLKPHLVEAGVEPIGTVVIGTVKGDLHDIGKNIVKMMLEGKGINVIDLGVDVQSEQFILAAVDNNADVICLSALLTTTMDEMKKVVAETGNKGIRGEVKIMIGGAPITQSFCDSIGADAYAPDAASCADIVVELINKKKFKQN